MWPTWQVVVLLAVQTCLVNLGQQLKSARKILTNALRSRRSRLELERALQDYRQADSGDIDIAVYFADPPVNLYQVRQWYGPLVALSERFNIAIISRSPSSMLRLIDESPLPVAYLRKIDEVETFVARNPLKIIFYVNQNARNFQMFRFGAMWHVFISHGESDKAYMSSNQIKAYDFAFVAGEMARQRLEKALWNYDADTRAIEIGRPQVDHFARSTDLPTDGRLVVLYAPTWEGDRPSMAYGSIKSHGEAAINALLQTGRHRVIYRPHPRVGVVDADYRRAHERIVQSLVRANMADETAHHVFDEGPDVGWQIVAADVAIMDVSAMVYDRLATGKPLLVCRPVSPEAVIESQGYLGNCEWLGQLEAGSAPAIADRLLTDSASLERLGYWSHKYFGDTEPGSASQRFQEAVENLVEKWQRAGGASRSQANWQPGSRDEDDALDPEGMPDRT